jgi:creatinine amidohydrolase/Fe(II)-dependent formamide hydrolase-like protein
MHNAALLTRALELVAPDVTVLALPPLEVGVSCEHEGFAGTVG